MKYVVDTNVISEIAKPKPSQRVIEWFWDHGDDAYLTTVNVEELYYGMLIMPDGKRKSRLKELLDAVVKDLAERTLPYDGFSAYLCATMRMEAKEAGRPGTIEDYMIASICKRHNAVLVTRNAKDFQHLGVEVVDPFEYDPPAPA